MNLGTGGAAGSTPSSTSARPPPAPTGTVINTPTVTFANGVTVVGMPQANLTALLLGLGGAVADAWNRLSVNTPAVLLNNAGAGIEATVNKAEPANDAAFAFKTGFSARALIGLLGSDDFSFKVSPDGSAYHDAIADRPHHRPGRAAEAGDPAGSEQRTRGAGVGQARALRYGAGPASPGSTSCGRPAATSRCSRISGWTASATWLPSSGATITTEGMSRLDGRHGLDAGPLRPPRSPTACDAGG